MEKKFFPELHFGTLGIPCEVVLLNVLEIGKIGNTIPFSHSYSGPVSSAIS